MRFLSFISLLLFITACDHSEKTSDFNTTLATTDSLNKESKIEIDSTLLADALKETKEEIRAFIEFKLPNHRYTIGDISLYSSQLLPEYYIRHAFEPLWFSSSFSTDKIDQFISFIPTLKYHGLTPEDYHLTALNQHFNSLKENEQLLYVPHFIKNFELLLSDAYIMIAAHLYHGKVDPEALTASWGIHRNKPEIKRIINLQKIAHSDSITACFSSFYPPYKGYLNMVKKAEQLDNILHKDIPLDINLKILPIRPGDSLSELPEIRKKLVLLGHLHNDSLHTSVHYDSITQEAIKSFQLQFGFQPDGIIGRNTLNALATPLAQLKQRLFINMERLRWLPDSIEHRHIFVNIADFTLTYFEGNDTLLKMRTVVGRNYRQTPVFNGKMTYLVFSPTWTVPPGILRNDVLPEIRKNSNYLSEKNMIVLDRSGTKIDPSTVDWKKNGMNYMIRQQPGPQNALGQVKFMFPNKHNVYLHDTPSKSFFEREQRLFSSGCIRIEEPKELAALLLNDMPRWNDEQITKAMNQKQEKTVVLKTPVGVYLYYLTAWSTPDGIIQFREDVYNRDEEIFKALNEQRTLIQL